MKWMEFRIWIENAPRAPRFGAAVGAQVKREATGIGPEEVGLSLKEGKTALRHVQAGVTQRLWCDPPPWLRQALRRFPASVSSIRQQEYLLNT